MCVKPDRYHGSISITPEKQRRNWTKSGVMTSTDLGSLVLPAQTRFPLHLHSLPLRPAKDWRQSCWTSFYQLARVSSPHSPSRSRPGRTPPPSFSPTTLLLHLDLLRWHDTLDIVCGVSLVTITVSTSRASVPVLSFCRGTWTPSARLLLVVLLPSW